MKRIAPRWGALAIAGPLICCGSVLAAPQLLAFPHKAQIGRVTVYAEAEFDVPQLAGILGRSDRLLRRSGLVDRPMATRLFLTKGGLRWKCLALRSHGAFALTRPVSDIVSGAVIVNTSDISADKVSNGARIGGLRSLSGTIAHEQTHRLVRQRFGLLRSFSIPAWKSEGFADYVANESSLSAQDVQQLKAAGATHPALAYYEGRQRVAEILARNNHSVEQLLLTK